MSEPLVIIGNGMAAARLCEELSQRALGRYAIAVVGKEPRLAYNRVLLSSVLAGEVAASDLTVKPADWWRKHGVTLCYGTARPRSIRPRGPSRSKTARTLLFRQARLRHRVAGRSPADCRRRSARRADIPRSRRHGISRSAPHAAARAPSSSAAGLLGIEAAYGLAKAGVAVTLVHLMDRLMERQLDARAAAMLKRAVEAKGITVELEAATVRLPRRRLRRKRSNSKTAASCRPTPSSIAVGIAPNAEIARSAKLTVNRGIVVDDGSCHQRPQYLRHRRMRRASRRLLRPGGAGQRTGPRACRAFCRTRCDLHRQRQRNEPESIRRSRVFRRATFSAHRARNRSCSQMPVSAPIANW